MRILVIILSIMIFMKTFTYGLYELKDCKNKKSAITLFSCFYKRCLKKFKDVFKITI